MDASVMNVESMTEDELRELLQDAEKALQRLIAHHLFEVPVSESRGGVSPPRAPRTVREPLDSYGSQCSALAIQKRPVGKQTRR